MRTNRIYIPIFLLLLSFAVLIKSTFTNPLILDVGYLQLSKESRRQVDCLAQNIYHEAGNEPEKGKIAVALVTMNRTQDPRFPKDICSVVKQRVNYTCQFSWFCDGNLAITSKKTYEDAKEVAVHVFANYDNLKDITYGALYYHADYVDPKWKLNKTVKIGRHIFYKERETKI